MFVLDVEGSVRRVCVLLKRNDDSFVFTLQGHF